ncbi:hypothetical protein D9611_010048 [Ephemerocybe angulata]|uniref:Uncharacterized protein n=1 Tax=Ephemerocybe angulata TaxID=980116 RepID=A0A8H5FFJ2_9AGAR|nr:hypothetical protein D9611_010048 [Tulosesus angulatus]
MITIVLAAFVCCAYIVGSVIPYTVKGFNEPGVDVNPQQIVVVALSALFALFTFTLTVSHVVMIMMGQTTVENMQIQTMRERESEQLGKAYRWWESGISPLNIDEVITVLIWLLTVMRSSGISFYR